MSSSRSGPGSAVPRIEGGQPFGDAVLGEDVTDSAQRLHHRELVADRSGSVTADRASRCDACQSTSVVW